MNTTAFERLRLEPGGARALWVFLRTTVASATRREAAYFLLMALLATGINLMWSFELLAKGVETKVIVLGVVLPLCAVPFLMFGWLVADRAPGGSAGRPWRLTGGVLLGSVLAAAVLPPLIEWTGVPFNPPIKLDDGRKVEIPFVVMQATFVLELAFFCGMAVAVFEMARRRSATQAAVDASRREQARLSRQLLESRLAAMQAQVEPQFLFDSLVDVQATYERDVERAAGAMDRLINYLRVALPRLRESGSTVQAEVDLLEAYLAVVSARHNGLPRTALAVDARAAGARFYPMLLLPLVQRAIRLAQARPGGGVPARVELHVDRRGGLVIATLRIQWPGLCDDDPELARVHERLAGLYDGQARLLCEQPLAELSQFTLMVPA